MMKSVPGPHWGRASVVVVMAILLSLSYWPRAAHARSGRSALSTLPRGHSSSLEIEDGNFSGEKAPRSSSTGRLGGSGGNPAAGGYSPRSIKGFWSHYHGARSERKSKSLEREK